MNQKLDIKIKIFIFIILTVSPIYSAQYHECLWHGYAYSGYAWCKKNNFTNPDLSIFVVDPKQDDSNLMRNMPFGGVALHRSVNSWLRLGFSYDSYATSAYQKFHTIEVQVTQLEYVWEKYQRQFSLQHRSAMFDCYLQTPANWRAVVGAIQIVPLIGASVGVGINNMYNFQTITHNVDAEDTDVTTICANNISKSLAWRIETGIKFDVLDSHVSFGVSYRYYCGGQFASGTTYMFTDLVNAGAIYNNLPSWKGVLKTNQIKLYINANFD